MARANRTDQIDAASLCDEALAAFHRGEVEQARVQSERALAMARNTGDSATCAGALSVRARIAVRAGDFTTAGEFAADALTLARAAGDPRREREAIHIQAALARMSGRRSQARELYEQSIVLCESFGDQATIVGEFHNLAYLELHDGSPERARERFAQSRRAAAALEDGGSDPILVLGLAETALLDGDAAAAASLAGTTAAAYSAAGLVPDPDDAQELGRLHEAIVAAIGRDRFDDLHEDGRRFSPRAALDQAARAETR